ncbi:MAG: hypothetical protein NVS3B11_25990 [Collimonas sp.]
MTHSITRRTFLKSITAVAGAAALPIGIAGCGGGNPDSIAPGGQSLLADRAMLWKSVEDMAAIGPRFTGGRAHRQWIDYLEKELTSIGLQPTRYPVPMHYWEAAAWSLKVTDGTGAVHDIPVAYYVPYAGETSAGGITAQLVDVGLGTPADYTAHNPAGKIVLIDRHYPNISATNFVGPVYSTSPPELASQLGTISYVRPWIGGVNLQQAKANGAVAAVVVLDLPPEAAVGQFTPHQQHQLDFPALNLDRVQGAKLRALMSNGPVTATLVLEAQRNDQSSIDFLAVKLPGSGKYRGAVAVLTHTDGQGASEENGAAAILSMARYFASVPQEQRARDIYFMLSATHMKPVEAGFSPQQWLNAHPDIKAEIVAAFTVEHLGAKEWDISADRTAYAATGKQEVCVLGIGNSDRLKSIASDTVQHSNLQRLVVTGPPPQGNLYGEATSMYVAGLPSITLISGPSYLVQVSADGGIGLLDKSLMYDQVIFCTELVGNMVDSASF